MVEVAESLGLSKSAVFFRVILRQLIPSILAGVLLVSLYVLSDFGAVSLLKYKTFSWSIFIRVISNRGRSLRGWLGTTEQLSVTGEIVTDTFMTHAGSYEPSGG